MSIASRFGSEWTPVRGGAHNEVHGITLEMEFDKFVTTPKDRLFTPADNILLMKEITQEEVIVAIRSLNRHKAGGNRRSQQRFLQEQSSGASSGNGRYRERIATRRETYWKP